jgi:hypothetical protein
MEMVVWSVRGPSLFWDLWSIGFWAAEKKNGEKFGYCTPYHWTTFSSLNDVDEFGDVWWVFLYGDSG